MDNVARDKSARLLNLLARYRRVSIVAHDNPDPDAIASGWALKILVECRLERSARLIAGGVVVRAENVQMLRTLHPPLELADRVETSRETATILVDCNPLGTNHLLRGTRPTAVIDHHEPTGARFRVRFRDIRPTVAASASIVASYLRAQALTPSPDLATALTYAIRTEVRGQEVVYSRTDKDALRWLADHLDHDKLLVIENAPLRRRYFADLMFALQNTFLYGHSAVCFLPQASGPEIIGEVADLLIRGEGVTRVLCGSMVGRDLLLSARSTQAGGDILEVLERVLRGLGSCGGHRHRAGGKVTGLDSKDARMQSQRDLIRRRWIEACGVHKQRRVRLIPESVAWRTDR